ncbi:RHS repeat-associated core domain-containing protein, partial [Paenibacillus lentus]|uniref:RHS repeat-associated core domain-containing protein n=1 Tax=Paenibacillus lentus TaxID=1338368 RepID=UPI0036511983
MQYLRARYYNPEIGRFLTEDTYRGWLEDPQSLNLYVYVGNNPLIYTDPSGHFRNPIEAWREGPEWLPFSKEYVRNYDRNLETGLSWIEEKNKPAGMLAHGL